MKGASNYVLNTFFVTTYPIPPKVEWLHVNNLLEIVILPHLLAGAQK